MALYNYDNDHGLIYPVEVSADNKDGEWEWNLLVARGKCRSSIFTKEWQDPAEMFVRLLNQQKVDNGTRVLR